MRLILIHIPILVLGLAMNSFAQINCPQLPITLNGHLQYCVGSPGSALSVAQNYAAYYWLPGQEITQSVVLTAGAYQVIITHYTGCQDTLDFEVEQVSNPPQPTITANGPTQFCQGESVLITGTEGYPFYTWNTGSVEDDLTVFESGTYVMSITDWIGCTSSSNSITITVDPLPIAEFSPDLTGFGIEFNNLSLHATDYEWNFGDGTGSSAFEPIHSYSSGGPHTVWLAASNECGVDTAFYHELNVSTKDLTAEFSGMLYPNPTDGEVTIELFNDLGEEMNISVMDAFGRVVMSDLARNSGGSDRIILGLSNLPSGIYLIRIESAVVVGYKPLTISR